MMPIKNFNLKCFVDCINELARSDEIERALWLCDNLPAYYRDHRPKEIVHLKNDIIRRLATVSKYANDPNHLNELQDPYFYINGEMTLRGALIKKDVEFFNKDNLVPHVVDLGPGNFWVPAMLNAHKLKYTYEPIGIQPECLSEAKKLIGFNQTPNENSPTIFLACEIIEHLWSEQEIISNMLSCCGWPDIAHITTPKYTFGFNLDLDWHLKRDLIEHLRAYTPGEFQDVVVKMFNSSYRTYFYDNPVMHLRLLKTDSEFSLDEYPNIEKEIKEIIEFQKKVFGEK